MFTGSASSKSLLKSFSANNILHPVNGVYYNTNIVLEYNSQWENLNKYVVFTTTFVLISHLNNNFKVEQSLDSCSSSVQSEQSGSIFTFQNCTLNPKRSQLFVRRILAHINTHFN